MSASPRSLPHTGHLYDLAIVGAGLAGSELAYHAARAGLDVLLVTQSLDSVGNLYHARVPQDFPPGTLFEQARAQVGDGAELWDFHRTVKQQLEETDGIHLLQSLVVGVQCAASSSQPSGQGLESSPSPTNHQPPIRLETWEGIPRFARRVVLAVGAFLEGRLRIGNTEEEAGRLSEVAYDDLYRDLLTHGLSFEVCEREAPAQGGGLPYRVRFQAIRSDQLEGCALRALEGVYALGQCVAGEHSYSSVLEDAARLSRELLREHTVFSRSSL